MELRQLRYFVVLADELNFRGAAGRLSISQPTLSQQITALEKHLNVRLFYRTKRQVRLTDSGRLLLDEMGDVLERLDRTADLVGGRKPSTASRLLVGVAPGCELHVLPRIVKRLKAVMPELQLVPRSMFGPEQIEGLRAGKIDVGLLRLQRPDPNLHMEVIHKEPLALALGRKHPLAKLSRVPLGDLARFPYIFFAQQCTGVRQKAILKLLRDVAVPFENILEGTNVARTLSLVGKGAGVSLLPASARTLRMDGIVFRPVQGRLPTDDIAFSYRKDDGRDSVRTFAECVREAFPKSP